MHHGGGEQGGSQVGLRMSPFAPRKMRFRGAKANYVTVIDLRALWSIRDPGIKWIAVILRDQEEQVRRVDLF